MEDGFSSPRSDAFPSGLRVLVVDDDPTWLKILEKMLKKCSYEVTTCGLARDALNLLRERKDGYDIVVSDVNMPDMDGFKLLEHVGLEMDLPVIMMSVDGEISRVMKGVQHGACDYLLKPIRMKELRNIWQHVLRKKIHEIPEIESHDCFMFGRGEDMNILLKKRKGFEKHDDKDICDASSLKKTRVVWSVDLHQKFVKAVDQIGFQRVGPKKILDLMNVPWLTRENVASHLQKYRLYLSRLQKQNEAQNLKLCLPRNSFLLQNIDSKELECNMQRIVSEPAPELKQGVRPSSMDLKSTHSEPNSAASQQTQINALKIQLKAESKTPTPLKIDFVDLPSTNQRSNFQVDQLQSISSISWRPSIGEGNRLSEPPSTGRGLYLDLFDNDNQLCWLQEDYIVKNLEQAIDFTDFQDSGLVTDYMGHDYWYDPTDYSD